LPSLEKLVGIRKPWGSNAQRLRNHWAGLQISDYLGPYQPLEKMAHSHEGEKCGEEIRSARGPPHKVNRVMRETFRGRGVPSFDTTPLGVTNVDVPKRDRDGGAEGLALGGNSRGLYQAGKG